MLAGDCRGPAGAGRSGAIGRETGLEEINGDLLQADFWTASFRICSVHNFRFARHWKIDTHTLLGLIFFNTKMCRGGTPDA